MFIIKTKNTDYNGVMAGIPFIMGEARVESISQDDIAWFKKYEATVIEEKKAKSHKKVTADEESVEQTDK